MQIWEQCGDCSRVPSQSQLLPAIEPGDPQRCGSTARVADSNCQRVQPALSVTAFSRASSPKGGAKGRLRRPAIYHTFPNRVTPNGVGLLPGWQTRIASGCIPALSVTACAVPAPPKGEPRGGRCPPSAAKFLLGNFWGTYTPKSPHTQKPPAFQPGGFLRYSASSRTWVII